MNKNNVLDYTPIFNIKKLKGLLKISISCLESENENKLSFLSILSNYSEDKTEITVRVIHGAERIGSYYDDSYNKYNKTYKIDVDSVISGDIEILPIEISY